jgi:cystathionine beta-lyase/cystathionine gamma-synthase
VERSCENALAIARFLEDRSDVRVVNYPGLESSPWHDTAAGQMSAFGGMLSFEVDGDLAAAHRVVDSLGLIRIVPSLGSVETTLLLPAVSSHYKFSKSEREAMGVPDGLIRLSVGIEEIEDILADLEAGLGAL